MLDYIVDNDRTPSNMRALSLQYAISIVQLETFPRVEPLTAAVLIREAEEIYDYLMEEEDD